MVTNLPLDMFDIGLESIFERSGELGLTRLVRNELTQQMIGLAFIQFGTLENVRKAGDAVHGLMVGGRKWNVTFAPKTVAVCTSPRALSHQP